MFNWDDLSCIADDALIAGLPPELVRAVEDAVAKGGDVRGCLDAVKEAGAGALTRAGVEALAERLVAQRDATRN